jgi:hypothetical protein
MKTHLKIFLFSFILLCFSCAKETQNREESESAFENNFGFKAPKTILDIKLKNWAMYDSQAHWMAFTNDSDVFKKIVLQDQTLQMAHKNTPEFENSLKEISENVHNPDWLTLPNAETDLIYYKKDFLDHTFSEYYLWTNKKTKMTYLYVNYFD